MTPKQENADALQEYREARAELTADLQLLSLLRSATSIAGVDLASTAETLAAKRVIKSRGRYENAVNALNGTGL